MYVYNTYCVDCVYMGIGRKLRFAWKWLEHPHHESSLLHCKKDVDDDENDENDERKTESNVKI